VALMRHRITSVIIAVRRSYTGPGHAHMPLCVRLARCASRQARPVSPGL